MIIYQDSNISSPFLSLVVCQHGNEPFGLEIIKALKPRLHKFPGLQLIIANEEALALNKRGVDGDLNRSFPGDQNGNHESRLAHDLLTQVRDSKYLLDVHTSVSSCGFLVPIVSALNDGTKLLINLLQAERIVHVEQPLSKSSLIGNVEAGLSLEFQKTLADQTALELTVKLIEDLYADHYIRPRPREVFTVTGVIEKDLELPSTAQDFELIETLGIFPILMKDPSYIGNQGLMATKKERVYI